MSPITFPSEMGLTSISRTIGTGAATGDIALMLKGLGVRHAGMLATWPSCKLRKTGWGRCMVRSCPVQSHSVPEW